MKTFKWTVEFTVDETWVADGFNLTDSRAKEMLANDLVYSSPHEYSAKVIKAPDPAKIAKSQGYNDPSVVLREIKGGSLV